MRSSGDLRTTSVRCVVGAALVALCVGATGLRASPALAAPDGPRLVLLLVVDQLRRGRLRGELPGGLGRLAREGQVHTEAVLDHAGSETCSGHASLVTGRHPGPAGVPGNAFVERASGEKHYCVDDTLEAAAVIGAPEMERGRSPRNLRVDAFGDWLERAHPGARVFSVSAKDRSAIAMGGRRPDGVYWIARQGAPGFTTSRYYAERLPAWVRDWNGRDPARDGFLAPLPDTWVHEVKTGWHPDRPDDYAFESDVFGRTSGHRLRSDDVLEFAEALYQSPFLDERTLDFALRLVREEGLGTDDVPDLLAVSLSATDRVGHLYGPESHEARDALVRLDRDLGAFLAAIEEITQGRLVVALSSDHGIPPIPEWLAETGRSVCPRPGGRRMVRWLWLGLQWRLHMQLGSWLSLPGGWLVSAGTQVTVNRAQAAERGVAPERVIAETKRYLEEEEDVIARAWTVEEILSGEGERARLLRNSFDAERSGDLVIELHPTCLVRGEATGTTHGSLHAYDRDVPIAFFGPGIAPRRVGGPAATVDVAPSLARWIGIEAPDGLDGRPLLPSRGAAE